MSKTFGNYTRHGINDAGSGSFGKVCFYSHSSDKNNILAGKIISNQYWRREEMEILRTLTHDNIVKCIDVAFNSQEVLLVTELLSSSLYDALRLEKKSLYTVTQTSNHVRVNHNQFQPMI